jgi:hypothetical protein
LQIKQTSLAQFVDRFVGNALSLLNEVYELAFGNLHWPSSSKPCQTHSFF